MFITLSDAAIIECSRQNDWYKMDDTVFGQINAQISRRMDRDGSDGKRNIRTLSWDGTVSDIGVALSIIGLSVV